MVLYDCVGAWGVGFRDLGVRLGVWGNDFGILRVSFGLGRDGCEIQFWGSGVRQLGFVG